MYVELKDKLKHFVYCILPDMADVSHINGSIEELVEAAYIQGYEDAMKGDEPEYKLPY